MELPSDGVKIYRIIERKTAEFSDYDDGLFLFYKNPNGFSDIEEARLTYVADDEIRFSKREIDSYVVSLNTIKDDTPVKNDSELLAKLTKLQAENEDLNARLSTARNTYNQHRNEIKALKEKNEHSNNEKAKLIEQLHKVELTDKPAIIDNDKLLYVTPAISIMNKVITEFWIDYDPNDPAPKQSTITDWITDKFDGVSDALALNIDKVCRHTSARSGGKYKR